MFSKEYFIMLFVNTIISIIVIFILFRLQDNKIRYYFKRLDKKLNYSTTQNIDFNNNFDKNTIINDKLLNPINDNIDKNKTNNINNDMDSYIDPLENDNN